MNTTDIAGLCKRLRGDLPFHEDDGAVNECAVYASLTQAADTLERQAAEIARMRGALVNIQIEAEREQGRWVHLKRVIAINARAALTGEDFPQPPNNERTG